jgi:hypothetical protein
MEFIVKKEGKSIFLKKKIDMRALSLCGLVLLNLISCNQRPNETDSNFNFSDVLLTDSLDMTNNFYDNAETIALPFVELSIEGEIENPGKVDFSTLPLHSVIVKETLLDGTGGDSFVGAYRYDGYSLFDILDKRIIKKANKEDFSPIIDLFIEIENDRGEKVIFSWGEIYYPNNHHKIIIASGVSRIVPSKSNDLWPLPVESRIIAASDLITERNISSPVKITVRSLPFSFPDNRELSPLYSPFIDLFNSSKHIRRIESISKNINNESISTVFYGRGRGIHSTLPFTGVLLKDLLEKDFPVNRKNLQKGMLCIAAKDGYHCAVSYSELFNRNDQQDFLLTKTKVNENKGLFRIVAPSDFFSDRAIKAVSEIHLGF